jgi:hypothetical protein
MIKRCIVLCVLLSSFSAYAATGNERLLDKIDRLENQTLLLEKNFSPEKYFFSSFLC